MWKSMTLFTSQIKHTVHRGVGRVGMYFLFWVFSEGKIRTNEEISGCRVLREGKLNETIFFYDWWCEWEDPEESSVLWANKRFQRGGRDSSLVSGKVSKQGCLFCRPQFAEILRFETATQALLAGFLQKSSFSNSDHNRKPMGSLLSTTYYTEPWW